MEITEVRIKLMEKSDDRLQAFCSITFDNCFVIRDLKIIEGTSGPFVAMPSRKLTAHCHNCGGKNHLRSQYCNHCGKKLKDDPVPKDSEGRLKLYADIAHPINSSCREMIQERVITEFQGELSRAQEPGYVSRYDDGYEDAETTAWKGPAAGEEPPQSAPPAESRLPPGAHREEAQPEVPAPHRAPSKQPAKEKPLGKAGDFGAGIFD